MRSRPKSPSLLIDATGMLPAARQVPSPNCDDRPENTPIELLVIHNIALPPGEFGGGAVEAFFCNTLDPNLHPYYEQIRDLRVSAHFFLRRNGELVQLVACHQAIVPLSYYHAVTEIFQFVIANHVAIVLP